MTANPLEQAIRDLQLIRQLQAALTQRFLHAVHEYLIVQAEIETAYIPPVQVGHYVSTLEDIEAIGRRLVATIKLMTPPVEAATSQLCDQTYMPQDHLLPLPVETGCIVTKPSTAASIAANMEPVLAWARSSDEETLQ